MARPSLPGPPRRARACACATRACRRQVTVKKGDSIGGFLKAVREQIAPEFRELRHVGVDNLLYIKVCHGKSRGGVQCVCVWRGGGYRWEGPAWTTCCT